LPAPAHECKFIFVNAHSRKPKAGLRDQLRETARAAMLDAAEELIAARGLHDITLAQIAKRAGVAVGTLYNYFADRDAMVVALFERRRATLRPMLTAAQASGKALAFEPRLRQLVHDVLAAFELHRRFIKVSIETEHARRCPSTTAADLQVAFDEVVAVGVAEGVVAKATAPLVALTLVSAIRAVVLRRTADGGDFVADAAPVVSLILDGARA
jgi:AcrR family transcriptional regulator